jgi:hypothetical protein
MQLIHSPEATRMSGFFFVFFRRAKLDMGLPHRVLERNFPAGDKVLSAGLNMKLQFIRYLVFHLRTAKYTRY